MHKGILGSLVVAIVGISPYVATADEPGRAEMEAEPTCMRNRVRALFAPHGSRPSPRLRELLSASGVSFSSSADPVAALRAWFVEHGGGAPPIEGAHGDRFLLGTFTAFRGADVTPAWGWWTDEGTFRLLDGTTKKLKMLEERRVARFGHFGLVRIIELPYGCEDLALVLILPETGEPERPRWPGGTGLGLGGLGIIAGKKAEPELPRKTYKDPRQALRDAEAELSNLDAWVSELSPGTVNISFPRFTVDVSVDLEAQLRRIGALPPSAGFSKAFEGRDRGIGAVAQQVVFTVDERSIRSNPAPRSDVGPNGLGGRVPVYDYAMQFHVDRPFLFAVRNTRSGAIHLIGRVVDPHDP